MAKEPRKTTSLVEDRAVERPSVGRTLEMPEKPALIAVAIEALEAGDPLVMVLTDGDGVVQPIEACIGGVDTFSVAGKRVTLLSAIDLEATIPASTIRAAWLLTATGAVLGECRLSSDLDAGGGKEAAIPGRALVFDLA